MKCTCTNGHARTSSPLSPGYCSGVVRLLLRFRLDCSGFQWSRRSTIHKLLHSAASHPHRPPPLSRQHGRVGNNTYDHRVQEGSPMQQDRWHGIKGQTETTDTYAHTMVDMESKCMSGCLRGEGLTGYCRAGRASDISSYGWVNAIARTHASPSSPESRDPVSP